jgi:assimilatory nitrate reductase catalytic subunit
LRKLYPAECYVEIHVDDARRLGIAPHARVRIASRRGELVARAAVTSTVQPGQVFLPMHYREVNRLTFPAFDTYSRQPSYKACAVSVEPYGKR